jgi:hypothetical protein
VGERCGEIGWKRGKVEAKEEERGSREWSVKRGTEEYAYIVVCVGGYLLGDPLVVDAVVCVGGYLLGDPLVVDAVVCAGGYLLGDPLVVDAVVCGGGYLLGDPLVVDAVVCVGEGTFWVAVSNTSIFFSVFSFPSSVWPPTRKILVPTSPTAKDSLDHKCAGPVLHFCVAVSKTWPYQWPLQVSKRKEDAPEDSEKSYKKALCMKETPVRCGVT